MKVNPIYSWNVISSNHFELLNNGQRIAFMAVHEGLTNRSARIILNTSELFIFTSGLWSTKTILVDEKGEFQAGYVQNKWFSNQYKYISQHHAFSMQWNNEESFLEIGNKHTPFLSLKLLGSQSFEIDCKGQVDLDLLFLSWFFFAPIVVSQPLTASLY